MTKIIKCEVTNILGARSVAMSPNGQSVTIGGANGQGKSSAIQALIVALGGKSKLPGEPVTHGADKGEVKIELDDLTVSLEVYPDRKTKLKVEANDGRKLASPQGILAKLFGNLAFDPGAFKSLNSEKRLQALAQVVGLDLSPLDREKKAAYEERTIIGRELNVAAGKVHGRKFDEELGTQEIIPSQLMEHLQECFEGERRRDDIANRLARFQNTAKETTSEIMSICDQVNKLIARQDVLLEREKVVKQQIEEITEEYRAVPPSEAESYKRQLAEIEENNLKIRANKETAQLLNELEIAKARHAEIDQKVADIDAKRKAALSAAKFPILGLSLEETDVWYKEVPFEQLSESEQWEVSTAISFALNRKSIVFMPNCGGLDARARGRVRARAAELGVQLFLEVVDDADDVQILIEEGKVLEDRLHEATQ